MMALLSKLSQWLPVLSLAMVAVFSAGLMAATHQDASASHEDRLPFCPPKGDAVPPINRCGSVNHHFKCVA